MKESRKALFCPIHQMSFDDIRLYYGELFKRSIRRVTPFYGDITYGTTLLAPSGIAHQISMPPRMIFAGDVVTEVNLLAQANTGNVFGGITFVSGFEHNTVLSRIGLPKNDSYANLKKTVRSVGDLIDVSFGIGSGDCVVRYDISLSGVLLSVEGYEPSLIGAQTSFLLSLK